MYEIEIREAGEGDAEAPASLIIELGYPSTVEEMGGRLAQILADPPYGTSSPGETVSRYRRRTAP